MRRDERVFRRAQLDFLHDARAVHGEQQPVRPPGDAQGDFAGGVIRAQRFFRLIGRFLPRARALPRLVRRRALPHALGGEGRRGKVALMQAEFHHLTNARAQLRHARLRIRRSDAASSSAPSALAPCAISHAVGG